MLKINLNQVLNVLRGYENNAYPGLSIIIRNNQVISYQWNEKPNTKHLNCHHAEYVQIENNLIQNGDTLIMTHPTCGHCRDFILKSNIKNLTVIYVLDHKNKANTFLAKTKEIKHINITEFKNLNDVKNIIIKYIKLNIKNKKGHTTLKKTLNMK